MSETEAGPQAQACPACGAQVETADAEPLARITCPNCGEKIRVERVFDHFVLVETLGVGGMGSVYKDFRSDVYSLGATLFHALSGRPPIEGETNSASQRRELKNQPIDLRSVAPGVSRETARIIHRMLAPDPAARFSSYQELIEELRKAVSMENRLGSRIFKRALHFTGYLFGRKKRFSKEKHEFGPSP